MVTLFLYFLALLLVGALLFLLASFAFGRGEEMAPMPPDVSPVVLPASRWASGRDLRRLRLSVVLRGYRMSEVDWVLDRLAREIDERDREISRLRREYEGVAAEGFGAPDADGTRGEEAVRTGAADVGGRQGDSDQPHGGERDGLGEPHGVDGDGAVRAGQPTAGEGAHG